jgi:GNAT superfamily N-acetyltransferase
VTLDYWPDPEFWGEPPDIAGYVHRLAVRRGHAGQDVGAALIDHVEREVAATGRPLLRLDCNKNSPRLHEFYKRLGFEHVGDVDLPHRQSGSLFERPARRA